MSERKEGWMRIVVGIVSGVILGIWKMLIFVLGIVNFIIVVFKGKRNRKLAEMSEIWNTQMYVFLKYMTFVSNKKPFPFESLEKNITKYEK